MGVRLRNSLRLMLVVAVAASVLGVLPATEASAAPARRDRRPTPQLLQEAVARGEIDQATADQHLAEVFVGRGSSSKVPARFQSDNPWDGTLPLLRLRERLASRPASPTRARTETALKAATSCGGESAAALPNEATSTHFYVSYGTVGGGLTINSYISSLEASWAKQITSYGWAAPPSLASPPPTPIGTRYPVRVDALSGGLYGFVSVVGTGAGFVGNNPNTLWDDIDAYASCMVLTTDYDPFPGTAQQALDATTAHELNHSIHFGYGAAAGPNVPDESFFEGGASWMEDEVFDDSDDNHGYLWTDFGGSLGDYNASPYAFWLMLRGLTERFGTGRAGGAEQVMQDFWEATSKGTGNNLSALAVGLVNRGVSLADAYHDFAIGAGFMKPCAGGYALPHCFEEADAYLAGRGLPPVVAEMTTAGGYVSSAIKDDYSLAWVTLPAGTYSITLANNSSGGKLRATAVCDTGTTLIRSPLPQVVGPSATTTLADFDATSCVRTLAVVTNEEQSPDNPSFPVSRSFSLRTKGHTDPVPGYTGLTPARLLDTRPGAATIDGEGAGAGAIGPGATRTVQVTGRGGVPSSGAGAVVLNITATEPTAAGYLTVYPTGTARPNASNLNFTPGQTIPNLVIAKVSPDGRVTIYNNSGSTHVIADVAGWSTTGSDYTALGPARLMDTRPGGTTIDGQGAGTGAIGPGATRNLQITGRAGVPSTGNVPTTPGAVVLNITATEPTAAGHLTVYPTGTARPNASNLNFTPGQTIPNLVIAKVSSSGQITIYNNSGFTHVIADIAGWFPVTSEYAALTPARILDTRASGTTIDGRNAGTGAIGPGATRTLQVTGRGGVPSPGGPVSGIEAVVLNITATEPTTAGYLTVYPTGTARPNASNLNFTRGQSIPNLVIAKVSPDGQVTIYNSSGSTHVIADVAGWFPVLPG